LAVAASCWVVPTSNAELDGVTVNETSVGAVIVTVTADPADLVINVALTVALPAVTAVTSPAGLTLATAVFELLQLADELTFDVDPSL
jgi:hypothetical protein